MGTPLGAVQIFFWEYFYGLRSNKHRLCRGRRFFAVYLVIAIVLGALLLIANWKIFTKAGQAGWKTLIPIYNGMVLFKIIYGSMGKFFLLIIPVFGQIYYIISMFRLARVFGKGGGFGFGLWVLPTIFTLILGFSKKIQYVGPFGKQNAQ